MNNGLKPCPFCGSNKLKMNKKKNRYCGGHNYYIKCNVCHARGGIIGSLSIPYSVKEDIEKEAINAWNRRCNHDK